MLFIANWKMYGNTADINKTKPVIKLANNKNYKKACIKKICIFSKMEIFHLILEEIHDFHGFSPKIRCFHGK